MSNNKSNAVHQVASAIVGLSLGQIFVFLILDPEGWQTIDKALFGVGLGMSVFALLSIIIYVTTKKSS